MERQRIQRENKARAVAWKAQKIEDKRFRRMTGHHETMQLLRSIVGDWGAPVVLAYARSW